MRAKVWSSLGVNASTWRQYSYLIFERAHSIPRFVQLMVLVRPIVVLLLTCSTYCVYILYIYKLLVYINTNSKNKPFSREKKVI